jgi:hypothetical protein
VFEFPSETSFRIFLWSRYSRRVNGQESKTSASSTNRKQMDEIGSLLEYSPRSLKRLARRTMTSKGTMRVTLKLLKFRPYKPRFCPFLASLPCYNCIFSEFTTVDLSGEARFSYLNTQNNRYYNVEVQSVMWSWCLCEEDYCPYVLRKKKEWNLKKY